MSHYVIVYVGGNQPSSPEAAQQHFAKYKQWLSALGAAAVSPANPLLNTRRVNPDGSVSEGGTTRISGYTIVDAESFDAAIEIARACPFLEIGGTLEVSELGAMP